MYKCQLSVVFVFFCFNIDTILKTMFVIDYKIGTEH